MQRCVASFLLKLAECQPFSVIVGRRETKRMIFYNKIEDVKDK